jgi:hypothetical protein
VWRADTGFVCEATQATCRDRILNMCTLRTRTEIWAVIEKWISKSSEEQPHNSSSNLIHWEFLVKHQPPDTPNLGCHDKWGVYNLIK